MCLFLAANYPFYPNGPQGIPNLKESKWLRLTRPSILWGPSYTACLHSLNQVPKSNFSQLMAIVKNLSAKTECPVVIYIFMREKVWSSCTLSLNWLKRTFLYHAVFYALYYNQSKREPHLRLRIKHYRLYHFIFILLSLIYIFVKEKLYKATTLFKPSHLHRPSGVWVLVLVSKKSSCMSHSSKGSIF